MIRNTLEQATPMAQAFVRLFHPFAEAVIHDLEKDKIFAIYNPISKRQAGDPSYLERWHLTTEIESDVIGPYFKTNYDGRKLKSISIALRDDEEQLIGFLCINMDVSHFDNYAQTLSSFMTGDEREPQYGTKKVFEDDYYEQLNLFIQKYCHEHHLSVETLSRQHKKELVVELHKQGAFEGKNATSFIARILKVSRATVYNYVKDE